MRLLSLIGRPWDQRSLICLKWDRGLATKELLLLLISEIGLLLLGGDDLLVRGCQILDWLIACHRWGLATCSARLVHYCTRRLDWRLGEDHRVWCLNTSLFCHLILWRIAGRSRSTLNHHLPLLFLL